VRIERDRRGGLRVFQGPALVGTGTGTRPAHATLPQPDVENDIIEATPIEVQPGEPIDGDEGQDSAQLSREPIPIDTTAELLGRAKPRKPRVRAARPAAAALAPRSPARTAQPKAAKKPAARRSARGRKPVSEANDVK
jgi:hypothetical protein